MSLALGVIKLAALEGGGIAGIGKTLLHFRRGQARELREKLGAALANLFGELGAVVGEEEERARGGEFLTLKQHGRAGREKHQSCDGAKFARRSQPITALAIRGVGYLIVILDEGDQSSGIQIERWRTS